MHNMELSVKQRFDCVKKKFADDRFAMDNGIKIIEVNDEFSRCELDIEPRHLNANNVVQGGMIYTLADIAYATHANFIHHDTVTQVGTMTYLKAAACKKLIAVARENGKNGRNAVGTVEVTDENGQTVAIAHFNGFIKPMTDEEYFNL